MVNRPGKHLSCDSLSVENLPGLFPNRQTGELFDYNLCEHAMKMPVGEGTERSGICMLLVNVILKRSTALRYYHITNANSVARPVCACPDMEP